MPRRHRLKRHTIFLSLFFLGLTLCLWVGQVVLVNKVAIAQDVVEEPQLGSQEPAREWVQQGVERYQVGDFRGAIALWEAALETYQETQNLTNQAIVLENLARAYGSLGDADSALPYWEQTLQIYQQLGDRQRVGRVLTEQAQAYINLGQYRQATDRLCGAPERCEVNSAVGIARNVNDRTGEAAALGSLGEAYRLQGEYDRAKVALTESLAIAQELDNSLYVAAATNSLGSLYTQLTQINDRRAKDAVERGDERDAAELRQVALSNNQEALSYFQQSLDAAQSHSNVWGQLRALLNLIPAYHHSGALPAIQAAHSQAIALLPQIPASRGKAYALIDLANLLPLTQSLNATRGSLAGAICLPPNVRPDAETLLMQAIATAEQIEDNRSMSFARGKLGHLYECQQDYSKALALTTDAKWAADQDLQSRDSLYLWQWQTGRILSQQGNLDQAIAAYEAATATLEKIRSDILTADRDIQFDFRDAVAPVYRQLAELRLSQAPASKLVVPSDAATMNINAALTAIDSLKLAELQNYFGDECIILASIDSEDTPEDTNRTLDARYDNTGVFSTFISNERTAIVLTLPDGQQRVEWLPISQEALNREVNEFRIDLETSLYSLEEYQPTFAASLYDRLIRPFIADLEQSGIETLVFVQDGIFRSIPMAALYDGQQYLIQRYAIATTPSLSLVTLTPPSRRQSLRALALGLSESATVDGRDFLALSGVRQELTQITEQLPGSQSLLNREFTRDRLRQELQEGEYSIIHMATHGEFGAEPEDTFLVTGDAQKLTIGELEAAIRQSGRTAQIDLLTLTACKTAIGDNRSALGLAGVAVQAGARSAIASLWAINDLSTAQMMGNFYQAFSNPDFTKAQALQTAQINAIASGGRFARPGFWAPFILVGDWR